MASITLTSVNEVRDGHFTCERRGILYLYNYMGISRITCIVEQIKNYTPTGEYILTYIKDIL